MSVIYEPKKPQKNKRFGRSIRSDKLVKWLLIIAAAAGLGLAAWYIKLAYTP